VLLHNFKELFSSTVAFALVDALRRLDTGGSFFNLLGRQS
jgi:hypothetical protein